MNNNFEKTVEKYKNEALSLAKRAIHDMHSSKLELAPESIPVHRFYEPQVLNGTAPFYRHDDEDTPEKIEVVVNPSEDEAKDEGFDFEVIAFDDDSVVDVSKETEIDTGYIGYDDNDDDEDDDNNDSNSDTIEDEEEVEKESVKFMGESPQATNPRGEDMHLNLEELM